MKKIVKAIMLSAPGMLAASGAPADGPAIPPATQPATQPSAQTVASNNTPLVIPDGTSGPVAVPGRVRDDTMDVFGRRM